MKFFFRLVLIALTASCSQIIKIVDKDAYYEKLNSQDHTHASLVFSHNINGETHPCGCRHFPLGGLPQVAGLFQTLSEKANTVYVDTGDTFFASTVIPKTIEKSTKYTALQIVEALEKLKLKFYLPGDQDFAAGEDFLAEISLKAKFHFLISNLNSKSPIKHQKYAKIEVGNSTLFLIAVLDPQLIPEYAHRLSEPQLAIENILNEIKKAGFNSSNQEHQLILLSHSGMEADYLLAKKFPRINWIIGAHSQSFTNSAYQEGSTKLVQVLSRNHYIGEIIFPLATQSSAKFLIHEVRDELAKKINPNPMVEFLENFKKNLRNTQVEEQKQSTGYHFNSEKSYPKASSCIECHQPQSEKWMSTAHALAFHTLIANEADRNTQCIGCHTLGFNDPRGFKHPEDVTQLYQQKQNNEYWKEIQNAFSPIKSVRSLSNQQRLNHSKQWAKIDEKFVVDAQYANVQCLNCHAQHPDHPFNPSSQSISAQESQSFMRQACLNCHTPDQSPKWYQEKGQLQDKVFNDALKKVACPKRDT